MIPSDYETVDVKRATVTLEDGVRTPGEPVHVGSLGMLVAPGSYERQDEVGRRTVTVGRRTVTVGADLYRRGQLPFDVRAGDLLLVRGRLLTVTRTPEEWRRGDRVIGVQLHAEEGRATL